MSKQDKYKFRKRDKIGEAGAEDDKHFLENCFVDTGDLEALLDCSKPYSIVVGRTGVGKTALLQRLNFAKERVIEVQPESLALNYISTINILEIASKLNVKLDVFFKLLWRHVFAIEILKHHYNITSEKGPSLWQRIKNITRIKEQSTAMKYLEKWKNSFWKETDGRIKEYTTNFERSLQASLKAKMPLVDLSLGGIAKLSEEKRREIKQLIQELVDKNLVKDLSTIVDILNSELTDKQKQYYITIDRLDEDWVEDSLRYRLIRALIETAKEFRKVSCVKIIIAIRLDLLDRVFKLTKHPGFQQEKYETLILNIRWTKEQLTEVLNKRISHLIKPAYTTQEVTYKDILPRAIDKISSIDFILERTLMRPRDVILFFNYCIGHAPNRPKFTVSILKQAEVEYSKFRLESLEDEWNANYPNLSFFRKIIENRKSRFKVSDIVDKQIEDICLELLISDSPKEGPLYQYANQFIDLAIKVDDCKKYILYIFYKVGLIRIKTSTLSGFIGISEGRPTIYPSDLSGDTHIEIHPMFRRTLGIKQR